MVLSMVSWNVLPKDEKGCCILKCCFHLSRNSKGLTIQSGQRSDSHALLEGKSKISVQGIFAHLSA